MNFENLLERISSKLKTITYKLNGHLKFIDAQDLFQEALVYIWICFQEKKLLDKTDSYILQGCYFHLKNYIRKLKENAILLSLENFVYDEETTFVEILNISEKLNHYDKPQKIPLFTELLENNILNKREKEILFLYCEGFTVREIARKLNISHVRVVKLKNKIKNKIILE